MKASDLSHVKFHEATWAQRKEFLEGVGWHASCHSWLELVKGDSCVVVYCDGCPYFSSRLSRRRKNMRPNELQKNDVLLINHGLKLMSFGHPHMQTLVIEKNQSRWFYRFLKKEDPKPFVVATGLGYSQFNRRRVSTKEIEITLINPIVSVYRLDEKIHP